MTIITNGKPDASIILDGKFKNDEITMIGAAMYPMAMEKQPYSAEVIGFGSGLTATYLLTNPLLKTLDIIEIEPAMAQLAKGFLPLNARAYQDPRANIRIADARTWIAQHKQHYDLIVSKPSNPWVSGVSSLFTTEFYAQAKASLQPAGVLVQWIHTYEFSNELMLSVFKALDSHFACTAVYRMPPANADIIILASQTPFAPFNLKRLAQIKELSKERQRLNVPLELVNDQFYITSTRAIRPLLTIYDSNSDNFPVLDNGSEKAFFMKNQVTMFNMWLNNTSMLNALLTKNNPSSLPDYKVPPALVSELAQRAYSDAKTYLLGMYPGCDYKQALMAYTLFLARKSEFPPQKAAEIQQLMTQKKALFPKPYQSIFKLLENPSAPSPVLSGLIKQILKDFDGRSLPVPFIRTLWVTSLMEKNQKLTDEIARKYVASNPEFSEAEWQMIAELNAADQH